MKVNDTERLDSYARFNVTVTVFRRTWTDTEELLKEVFFHTFLCVLV